MRLRHPPGRVLAPAVEFRRGGRLTVGRLPLGTAGAFWHRDLPVLVDPGGGHDGVVRGEPLLKAGVAVLLPVDRHLRRQPRLEPGLAGDLPRFEAAWLPWRRGQDPGVRRARGPAHAP